MRWTPEYNRGFWHGVLVIVAVAGLCLVYSAITGIYLPHHAIDASEVVDHHYRFAGKRVKAVGHVAAIRRWPGGYSFLLCDRGAQILITGKGLPMLYDGIDGEEVTDGEWVGVDGIYSFHASAPDGVDSRLSNVFIYDMSRALEDAEAAREDWGP